MLLRSAMLLRFTLLVAVLAGCSLLSAGVSRADDLSPARMCPGYKTALEKARGAVAQGKRAEAVAALRRAKEALRRCRREEVSKTNILAAARADCGRKS